MRGKSFLGRKNPYGDKKFAIAVSEFQKQGLTQLDLQKILPDFVNSKDGVFLRDKYNQIDKNPINQTGIHGIKHNDRVAILSLIIGQEEGTLKEESTREREILTYAAYYHDIGRKMPIGPHAKRSAKLFSNLKLTTLEGKPLSSEDKRITQLLIEGHEGKDEKVEKLIKKYNIADQDVEMVKNLTNILKDADALDRSRLAIDTPIATITDLDPKYLRLNTSKRLIEASYGLEYLTKKVNTNDLFNYKNENVDKHYYNRRQNIENLKVDKETMELNRKRNLRNQEKNVSNNKQEKGEEKE